jgi:hypothetical protein
MRFMQPFQQTYQNSAQTQQPPDSFPRLHIRSSSFPVTSPASRAVVSVLTLYSSFELFNGLRNATSKFVMNIHSAQDSAIYWYTIWISLAEALSKSAAGLEPPPPPQTEI